MARQVTPEELEELRSNTKRARQLSPEEVEQLKTATYVPRGGQASFTDYLRAVPATAVDITMGSAEGLAAAIGDFTGDYDVARAIGEARTDINDVILGDAPESVKSDFAYKLSSGLGSTIPYIGAAILAKKPQFLSKVAANGFFLSSAGQQVRDDYLATKGVTSETATDEQMSESVKFGAIGAIPIALSEKLGAGAILKPFSRGPIPAGKVMERISQYATAGAGEAVTELAQSGIINSMAAYVGRYDEDRPITQGMAESALIGFLVGGGINAGVDTVDRALTQSDRLKGGVADGSINAKDVIDPDIGSQMAEIAMENGSIPEVDSTQQSTITDRDGISNFISKTLTPISRRLGRAGRDVVREFRKFELDTGVKVNEFKEAANPFSKRMLELKKESPEEYAILARALANANELSTSLPNSVQNNLEIKAQAQPQLARSSSEQFLDAANTDSQVINQQIEQAREALAASGLKTQIRIVESGNSYYDPSSNTIAISAEQADGSTMGHEYFHAALGQSVKTDAELQSMTRNMFDSVIRASVDGSSLNEQLKGFVSQYDENIQNEEFLAQTVGELARQYKTLDINTRTRIKVWISQVMQKLGVSGVFKQAETDVEVVEQLNAFARFSGDAEALTAKLNPSFINEMLDPKGKQAFSSEPIQASKLQLADFTELPKLNFTSKPSKYSRIANGNQINFAEFVAKLKSENATVSFWAADQFGSGTYKDSVSGKSYDLDGGISFPLDKRGKRKDYVWASTTDSSIRNMLSDSDYVFLVSGKPDSQLMFNSKLHQIVADRAKKQYGSLDNAFDQILSLAEADGKNNAATKSMQRIRDFGADNYFVEKSNTDIGDFLKLLKTQYDLKTESEYRDAVRSIMPDPNELRDGFLKDNDFQTLDIMGIIQPDGVKVGSSGHGTYNDGVTGKFIGVPDVKVPVYDLFTDEAKGMFRDEMVGKSISAKTNKHFKQNKVAASDQEIAEFSRASNEYASSFMEMPTKYHGVYTGGSVGYKTRNANTFIDPTPVEEAVTAEQMSEGADAIRNQKSRPKVTLGTPAFKSWFGKSKVVDKKGKPIVVYHGTGAEFGVFDSDAGEGNDIGFHFGTASAAKDRLAGIKESVSRGDRFDEGKPRVMEAFLRIENPLRLKETRNGSWQVIDILNQLLGGNKINPAFKSDANKFSNDELTVEIGRENNGNVERVASWDLNSRSEATEWMNKYLQSKGFDGIVYENKIEDKGRDSYIVFASDQIKSATNNNGEYSSRNPDIRFQRERAASEEEIMRGLSDDGARILEKYGMSQEYSAVRGILDQIKSEYEELGLDASFIENYFPRYIDDLNGLKQSYGQPTGMVDQEIARYEKMTGQKLSEVERQIMYEKLARSRMYRGGLSSPSNMKERRTDLIKEDQMKYYADPEVALNGYIERMVNAIETKKLIGDAASGKTEGVDPVSGRLGKVMDKMLQEGRLRDDQIEVIQGVVAARFGQHGSQYGFVKGAKNMGYLATMGNMGSTLTQLGDFYFTMVQNGLIPTLQAVMGSKAINIQDMGIARDFVEIDSSKGEGMFADSVKTVFKWTGLTSLDRLAKNTNINAAHRVLTAGAKANPNSNKYKKALARLKRTQGNDAYKTIADLKAGKKSELVVEALYNELADVAPISLTEMPEAYSSTPNLRIMYSLKSYSIKQFNFVRERVFAKLMEGLATKNPKLVGEASRDMMKILAFSVLANGSADILKAIMFNREIDEDEMFWNTFLRMFGITKYTTTQIYKEGLGTAMMKTVAPPQFGMLTDVTKDITSARSVQEMRSIKYVPFVGKLYYWRVGKGKEVEERLSRLK